MAASRWMFTKEQLQNTPSRKHGIEPDKELSYRQQAANLIQDMGQRLSVTQLCINTAIVYMHRFYMFRSFTRFPRNEMAPACLFLAAKVEEQPRKLEHVIKVAHSCLHREPPAPDFRSEAYFEQAQVLVMNENVLLQTLGFEVTVDHPHTHVVKAINMVNASKDLSQTSYFLATNSLHVTALCLQYRPTIVACVCIYLACKWSNWKIPRSNEGKEWFQYVDETVTLELLEEIYKDFLRILDKCPHKLKKKIMGMKGGKDEEYQRSVNEHMKSSSSGASSHFTGTTTQATNQPSSSQHKHTNHERKDVPDPALRKDSVPKDARHDNRHPHGHDQRDAKGEHRKEWSTDRNVDKRGIPNDKRDRDPAASHSDRRDHTDPHKLKLPNKDPHLERREGHPHTDRKDPLNPQHRKEPHSGGLHFDKKDAALAKLKSEPNVGSRSHSSVSDHTTSSGHSITIKTEPGAQEPSKRNIDQNSQQSSQQKSEIRKNKPETPLNYREYLKRKEQERIEKEKLQKPLKPESETLNKTFTESNDRGKHRPPKLDISLPITSSTNHKQGKDRERPYEVNIKSPIKPHHNITVKSPIKSSDLKQPKLEITKVQITPEKDGKDNCSVNVNNDPNIKKMMETSIKQEPGLSDLNGSHHGHSDHGSVKITQEASDSNVSNKTPILDIPVQKAKVKEEEELEEGEITLNPEHSIAPSFKIKELRYDPENGGLDSAASLKLSIKHEGGSGRSTPIVSHKSDSGSGASTPIRLKLPISTSGGEASPLKLKISTKGIKTDSDHSSSKHSSPQRRHKEKHKSHKHKHSKDKHRDKDRHKEHRHSNSSTPTGSNGQSLKMSIKLSDLSGHSNDSWSVKNTSKHDKHKKSSMSDPHLNRNMNANSLDSSERQQPWSMSALVTKSSTSQQHDSPSRKRRRCPTVDQNNIPSFPKSAKTESEPQHHRLRRSSSSHSVVDMEMSDGEDAGQTNGPVSTTGAIEQPQAVNQIKQNLQQMINMTKKQIAQQSLLMKQQQNSQINNRNPSQDSRRLDRQQSGFDLDGMMWAGNHSTPPPLPPGALPPLPPQNRLAPPPPPH